jgi:hypothetical protein
MTNRKEDAILSMHTPVTHTFHSFLHVTTMRNNAYNFYQSTSYTLVCVCVCTRVYPKVSELSR